MPMDVNENKQTKNKNKTQNNNKKTTTKSFSLPTFSLSAGCKSRINLSLILQCTSDRPVAKMSKRSYFILLPVSVIWSAMAEEWLVLVSALKCSVLPSCNRRFVYPM